MKYILVIFFLLMNVSFASSNDELMNVINSCQEITNSITGLHQKITSANTNKKSEEVRFLKEQLNQMEGMRIAFTIKAKDLFLSSLEDYSAKSRATIAVALNLMSALSLDGNLAGLEYFEQKLNEDKEKIRQNSFDNNTISLQVKKYDIEVASDFIQTVHDQIKSLIIGLQRILPDVEVHDLKTLKEFVSKNKRDVVLLVDAILHNNCESLLQIKKTDQMRELNTAPKKINKLSN